MDLEGRLRQSGSRLRQTDAAPPPDGVTDLARRHRANRHRRFAAVGVAAALLIVAGALAVTLGGGHHGPAQLATGSGGGSQGAAGPGVVSLARSKLARATLPAGSPAEEQVAAIEQDFAFALLRQVAAGQGQGNVVVSPSSIATALSMLELGAAGPTEQQIATALQSTSLTPEQQAAGWNALTADLSAAAASDKIELHTANDTWIEKTFGIKSGYLDALARNFGVGVYRTDFKNQPEAARQAINAKVADETQQKITDLIPQGAIDTLTRLVLTNAVYFKAAWASPFDPKMTTNAPFHAPSGDVTVAFMHSDELTAKALSSTGVDAVELPYAGGRFAALVVEPKTASLDAYLKSLDPPELADLLSRMRQTGVALAMPRFEAKQSISLRDTLKTMGMKVPFTSEADFSPISDVPTEVAAVEHQAWLKVTEAGTEAAAATAVINRLSAAIATPVQITIDRPFLFLIRDTQTGTILFAAAIQQP